MAHLCDRGTGCGFQEDAQSRVKRSNRKMFEFISDKLSEAQRERLGLCEVVVVTELFIRGLWAFSSSAAVMLLFFFFCLGKAMQVYL